MEGHQTLTFNSHYFTSACDALGAALRKRYHAANAPCDIPLAAKQLDQDRSRHLQLALSSLTALGVTGVTKDDLFKLVKTHDEVEPLLNMAAATLACEQPGWLPAGCFAAHAEPVRNCPGAGPTQSLLRHMRQAQTC